MDFSITADYIRLISDVVTFFSAASMSLPSRWETFHTQQSQFTKRKIGKVKSSSWTWTWTICSQELYLQLLTKSFQLLSNQSYRECFGVCVKDEVINHCVCQDVVFIFCQIWKGCIPLRDQPSVLWSFCFNFLTSPEHLQRSLRPADNKANSHTGGETLKSIKWERDIALILYIHRKIG